MDISRQNKHGCDIFMLYYSFFSQKSQVIRTVFSIFRPAAITETNYLKSPIIFFETESADKKYAKRKKTSPETPGPASFFRLHYLPPYIFS